MSLYLAQVLDVSSETETTLVATKQQPPPPAQPQQTSSDANGGSCVIRSAQMRRLNFEPKPTISDVYHERKIGLGLAPSLLKLLSLDKVHSAGKDGADSKTGGWLSPSVLKRFGAESAYGELNRRDEGDGRSVAESQSSTSSYKKRVDPTTSSRNFECLVEEDNQQKSGSGAYNREPIKIRLKKKSSCVPPPPVATAESSSSSPSVSNSYIVNL